MHERLLRTTVLRERRNGHKECVYLHEHSGINGDVELARVLFDGGERADRCRVGTQRQQSRKRIDRLHSVLICARSWPDQTESCRQLRVRRRREGERRPRRPVAQQDPGAWAPLHSTSSAISSFPRSLLCDSLLTVVSDGRRSRQAAM